MTADEAKQALKEGTNMREVENKFKVGDIVRCSRKILSIDSRYNYATLTDGSTCLLEDLELVENQKKLIKKKIKAWVDRDTCIYGNKVTAWIESEFKPYASLIHTGKFQLVEFEIEVEDDK